MTFLVDIYECKHYIASTSKKRDGNNYNQQVREVEHATFAPLRTVVHSEGGMGCAAMTFYKRLVSMVAEKRMSPML